jgi:HD-GYP domain-containing protein (c-di-GMP phosphodiesterase class II)
VVDVFHTSGGAAAAVAEVRARRGRWFDPALVAVFEAVAEDAAFWAALAADDVEQRVMALEPAARELPVTEEQLDAIAEAFGLVVDSKSPYTAGHSARVAHYVDSIARQLGLTPERRRWLRRGALLHDLGKLGVSNTILDKPGKLTGEEWAAVRLHAVYTEQILARIGPFRTLAAVAGAHHERLDGTGYPGGLQAPDIALETRIITVADVFDAITADRPYRGPIPVPQALEIMGRMAGSALDPVVLEALRQSLDELIALTAEAAASAPA